MSPIMIPTVGLVLWLVHVAQVLTGRRPAWARWACLVGFPLACIASYAYWTYAIPVADPATTEFSRADSLLLGNAVFGMGAWLLFLVLEPVLVLVGRQVAGRRGATARG